MKPRLDPIAVLLALVAGTLTIAACNTTTSTPPPAPPPPAAPAANPLSDNGVWTVPDQVKPGRYLVTDNPGSQVISLRWAQLCADPYCDQPGDVAYGTENRTLVIPSDGSVGSYRNNGVTLTPVGDQK